MKLVLVLGLILVIQWRAYAEDIICMMPIRSDARSLWLDFTDDKTLNKCIPVYKFDVIESEIVSRSGEEKFRSFINGGQILFGDSKNYAGGEILSKQMFGVTFSMDSKKNSIFGSISDSEVEVRFDSHSHFTMVIVEHRNVPKKDVEAFEYRWNVILGSFKTLIETGNSFQELGKNNDSGQ